jgi:hypothetical protein
MAHLRRRPGPWRGLQRRTRPPVLEAAHSLTSCLSLPQVPSARPNSLSTQELGREGRQSTRWKASRGDPSWENRGVLAPEARSASAGERRACFQSSALLLGGAPRHGTQQMCALPARVRCPRHAPVTQGTTAARRAAYGSASGSLQLEAHSLTPRSTPPLRS